MIRGVELSGVKKIRLHDLRHSHASLLISKLGAQPLMVAQRLGHEKIQTTLNTYSHLYPNQARDLADQLNGLNEEDLDEEATDYARKTYKPNDCVPAKRLAEGIDRGTGGNERTLQKGFYCPELYLF